MIASDLECRLLDASIIAYDIKNGSINPDTTYYKRVGIKPGTVPQVFTHGPEQINAGFVAETFDDWVLLVFRGTLPPFTGDFWAWVDDWLNDFRAGPKEWTVHGEPFGKVETGFADAVLSLWPAASKALQNIDLKSKKGILVTGHSKGGGMSFPAATWVKSTYPDVLVEVCTFAAPLTCDRTFRTNYEAYGLRAFTVRYQNRYDIVPFLPYWPYFAALATAERLSKNGKNEVLTSDRRSVFENDYVPIGILRYLGDGCQVEYGEQGQSDADKAIWYALEHLEFTTIADAHSAKGRYHECICKSP